jgi:hypothetical protein
MMSPVGSEQTSLANDFELLVRKRNLALEAESERRLHEPLHALPG